MNRKTLLLVTCALSAFTVLALASTGGRGADEQGRPPLGAAEGVKAESSPDVSTPSKNPVREVGASHSRPREDIRDLRIAANDEERSGTERREPPFGSVLRGADHSPNQEAIVRDEAPNRSARFFSFRWMDAKMAVTLGIFLLVLLFLVPLIWFIWPHLVRQMRQPEAPAEDVEQVVPQLVFSPTDRELLYSIANDIGYREDASGHFRKPRNTVNLAEMQFQQPEEAISRSGEIGVGELNADSGSAADVFAPRPRPTRPSIDLKWYNDLSKMPDIGNLSNVIRPFQGTLRVDVITDNEGFWLTAVVFEGERSRVGRVLPRNGSQYLHQRAWFEVVGGSGQVAEILLPAAARYDGRGWVLQEKGRVRCT
ncbi:MAG: hypothetical protein IPJ27_23265 [Candidatus Accumulibacter sp.]|uniref:SH3 domain-containing protein n=1 Tax=Candidatus Accumulibacter proximus TaxID=2954385 RepID=A0A935Q5C5_9PROT|nr:hypothetical protein [Candidatus Accumulibacter proximus]